MRKLFTIAFLLSSFSLPALINGQTEPSIPLKPCICPKFEALSNLDVVKAGEIVEFEIVSQDSTLLTHRLEWTVSEGEIVAGQGTTKISVRTSEKRTTPSPPATPANDPHGYIIFGSPGSRSLTAIAKIVENRCACPSASVSMSIGRRSRPRNQFADLVELTLSDMDLVLPCRPGYMALSNTRPPSKSMVLDVTARAFDPENDVLVYEYKVSAGQIIDRGPTVKWDLSAVGPGTYMITAGADDGCGLCGKTITRIVTVEECGACDVVVACPNVALSNPTSPAADGLYRFTASVSTASYVKMEYFWTVTNSEIVDGQGTPSVTIRAPLKPSDPPPTVTIRIGTESNDGSCSDTKTFIFPKDWLPPR